MRAPNSGERKLTELDFIRLKRFTAAGTFPQLADIVNDAEPATGWISVLSPAGMGLLGLSVGALARWVGPAREETVAQIEGILFQPEATGDYVT